MSANAPVESDQLVLRDGSIYDVKGYDHPKGYAVAYPRYIPSKHGDRTRGGLRYRKVRSQLEAERIARIQGQVRYDPHLGRMLSLVSLDDVAEHLTPRAAMAKIMQLQPAAGIGRLAVELVRLLNREAGVDPADVGVIGSLLADTITQYSDIDLAVYGSGNARKLRTYLTSNTSELIRKYDTSELKALYLHDGYDKQVQYQTFRRHQELKTSHAVYKEHPFFIRYLRTGVKNNHSKHMAFPLRHARIRAVVLDDSESHYTPAKYILDDALIVPLEIRLGRIEVLAYRSRFAEQASIHDEVVGEGMLESVWNIEGGRNLRLILGSSQNDFIWRARLLTKRGMQTKNED